MDGEPAASARAQPRSRFTRARRATAQALAFHGRLCRGTLAFVVHPGVVFSTVAGIVAIVAVLATAEYSYEQLRLSGDVLARTVSFQVNEAEGLVLDGDYSFGSSGVALRSVLLPSEAGKPAERGDLDLTGRRIALSRLFLAERGRITLTRQAGSRLEMALSGAAGSLALEVAPASATEEPYLYTAQVDAADTVPVLVRGDLAEQFGIDDVGVSALRFGQRRTGAADPKPFLSSIMSGHLTIGQTGQTFDLGAGVPLAMADFTGTIVRLQTEAEGLHLWFVGRGSAVTLGTIGSPKDVTPKWLDVIRYQQPVLVIWSAVAAFLGLLSNVMQWHGKREPK